MQNQKYVLYFFLFDFYSTLSSILKITPNCDNSISSFLSLVNNDCSNALSKAIHSPIECIKFGGVISSINCLDPHSVIEYTGSWEPVIQPPRPLANFSNCSICSTQYDITVNETCKTLIKSIVEVSSGFSISSIAAFQGVNPLHLTQSLTSVGLNCSNTNDLPLLTLLRDQSEIICASSKSFGYPVSSINTVERVLDMRHMFQCGTCSLSPCLPGEYCPGNSPALICPKRFYCPTPSVILSYLTC